jgi:hypothetical protein
MIIHICIVTLQFAKHFIKLIYLMYTDAGVRVQNAQIIFHTFKYAQLPQGVT